MDREKEKAMSDNTQSFIGSLVEMAKAYEELPGVKYNLDLANSTIQHYADTVREREESILRLKAKIETLNAKVRSTEVERDDAELRFLEADERTNRALDFIKNTFGNAGSLIQALEPPKPVAEPIPTYTEDPLDQRAADPTQAPVNLTGTGTESGVSSSDPTFSGSSVNIDSVGVGQSADPLPTSGASSTESGAGLDAETAGATLIAEPGPYSGLLYRNVPGYIPLQVWLDDGGTKENYFA